MRRLTAFLLLTTLTICACKRRPDEAPPEAPADLLPAFEVADPRATVQMTRGFYNLEGNTWRWTAPEFSVVLAPPGPGPLQLELKFNVPDVVFSQTGPLTISASAAGQALPPQTYSSAGDHTYTADVPGGSQPIAIDFNVDKHITPGGEDTRDLSIIATGVGLAAK